MQRRAKSAFRKEFPVIQEQHQLTLNMSSPGLVTQPQQELGGFVLSRDSRLSSGSPRTITVSRESIQVAVADYSRWADVKAQVFSYFSPLVHDFPRPFSVLALQYQDVFNWRDKPENLPLQDVLNRNSSYLASNVFNAGFAWHSHHGYFEKIDVPIECRRLNNINVSRVSTDGSHSIQIVTAHRTNFREQYWDRVFTLDSVNSQIFEGMHSKNKEILQNILGPEVQKMIKLNKEEVSNGV